MALATVAEMKYATELYDSAEKAWFSNSAGQPIFCNRNASMFIKYGKCETVDIGWTGVALVVHFYN